MSERWLLDTNACIAVMNGIPKRVRLELMRHPVASVGISVITLYELKYGINKSTKKDRNSKTLDGFLQYIQVHPWTESEVEEAARIRFDLERQGHLIGPHDILIAAHASSMGASLVTHNTREFERVDGLKIADWEQQ